VQYGTTLLKFFDKMEPPREEIYVKWATVISSSQKVIGGKTSVHTIKKVKS
jgi:hypothetical protein